LKVSLFAAENMPSHFPKNHSMQATE